jgi:hypothetical protein
VDRYVVAPTSDAVIDGLKIGAISIRAALDQTILWLVDVANDGAVVACWSQRINDLPAGAVPAPNVLLYRHLSQEYKTTRFVRSESDGQIAFDGTPVHDHEIAFGFYGKFIERFQELYNTVSRVFSGKTFGDLRGGLGVVSSYAIDVNVPDQGKDVFGIDEADTAGAKAAFDFVASMMSGDRDTPELAAAITQHQDLRKQYGSVLELMSKKGAVVLFRTRQVPAGRRLTNQDATLKFNALKELGLPYGSMSISGKLIGSQIERVGKTPISFTLKVSDTLTYTGTIQSGVIDKVVEQFGKMVLAKIRVHVDGDKPQTYELVDVLPTPTTKLTEGR